jgi:hypothetical protein
VPLASVRLRVRATGAPPGKPSAASFSSATAAGSVREMKGEGVAAAAPAALGRASVKYPDRSPAAALTD